MISKQAQYLLEANKKKVIDASVRSLNLCDDKLGGHDVTMSLDAYNISNFKLKNIIDEKQAALILSFLTLVNKIGLAGAAGVKFREVESFLRDDNSIDAWEGSLGYRSWMNEMRDYLLQDLFYQLMNSNKNATSQWKLNNINDRISNVRKILDSMCDLLTSLNVTVELVTIEETEIYIKFNTSDSMQKLIPFLGQSLAQYIRFIFNEQNIKLVAQ